MSKVIVNGGESSDPESQALDTGRFPAPAATSPAQSTGATGSAQRSRSSGHRRPSRPSSRPSRVLRPPPGRTDTQHSAIHSFPAEPSTAPTSTAASIVFIGYTPFPHVPGGPLTAQPAPAPANSSSHRQAHAARIGGIALGAAALLAFVFATAACRWRRRRAVPTRPAPYALFPTRGAEGGEARGPKRTADAGPPGGPASEEGAVAAEAARAPARAGLSWQMLLDALNRLYAGSRPASPSLGDGRASRFVGDERPPQYTV